MASLAIALLLLSAWLCNTFGIVNVAMTPKIAKAMSSSESVKPFFID
jgi:hypothetical protein